MLVPAKGQGERHTDPRCGSEAASPRPLSEGQARSPLLSARDRRRSVRRPAYRSCAANPRRRDRAATASMSARLRPRSSGKPWSLEVGSLSSRSSRLVHAPFASRASSATPPTPSPPASHSIRPGRSWKHRAKDIPIIRRPLDFCSRPQPDHRFRRLIEPILCVGSIDRTARSWTKLMEFVPWPASTPA